MRRILSLLRRNSRLRGGIYRSRCCDIRHQGIKWSVVFIFGWRGRGSRSFDILNDAMLLELKSHVDQSLCVNSGMRALSGGLCRKFPSHRPTLRRDRPIENRQSPSPQSLPFHQQHTRAVRAPGKTRYQVLNPMCALHLSDGYEANQDTFSRYEGAFADVCILQPDQHLLRAIHLKAPRYTFGHLMKFNENRLHKVSVELLVGTTKQDPTMRDFPQKFTTGPGTGSQLRSAWSN